MRRSRQSYTVNFLKMIGPLEKKPTIRIAGYLEKKGKMRMLVSRWKRWWFVLEGRLLLYYKSQMEYLNLSPCRGSLNMGLAASVQPGKRLELTVVTRSQSVTLRTNNRAEHEQWLQSLLDAMALPNSVNNLGSRPVMYFRYASQEYHENITKKIKNVKCPSFGTVLDETSIPTHPGSSDTTCSSSHASGINQARSEKCLLRRVFSDSRTLLQRPCKRNSVRLSKIAFSDTSIPISTQAGDISRSQSSEKCHSMQELHESLCFREEVTCVENSVESKRINLSGSKESKLSNSIRIELNLEDLDTKNSESVSEKKIGNITITLDGCTIYGSRECSSNRVNSKEKNKSSSNHNNLAESRILNPQLHGSKQAKSDSNLAVTRRTRIHSVSCENVQTDRSIGSTYNDTSVEMKAEQQENERESCRKTKKKRSNSILSRFLDNKEDTEKGNFERMGTIRKRLSFLRKMWKKAEKKSEEDTLSNDYESIPIVTELSSSEVEKAEELLISLGGIEVCGPEPEPPPDYDVSPQQEPESPPELPPRLKQRPPSPWHDVPKNNKPVEPEDDIPPPLPLKQKQKVLITISQDSSVIEHKDSSISSCTDSDSSKLPSIKKLDDLDTLLAQLSDVNSLVVRQIDVSHNCSDNNKQKSAVESDYDVPRPHISLLATLNSQNICLDSLTATNFLCTTPLVELDSLDTVTSRLDAEMTADSLECDSPWSLTHATLPSHSSHSDSMLRHFFPSDDKLFPDSLNS